MKLLDIESKPGNWRCLAERLGASYLDVQFLESRNHESPTQHVLNVFETMNKSLTFLRDIFIDFDRHDVVSVLNDEINKMPNRPLVREWAHTPPYSSSTKSIGSLIDVKDQDSGFCIDHDRADVVTVLNYARNWFRVGHY